MDNYATHKRVEVGTWLTENPRIHVHFIPTSASWLNLIDVWLGSSNAGHPPRNIRRPASSMQPCQA